MSGPWRSAALGRPIDASVELPGSKSLTIRALFAGAFAPGESLIENGLDATDTRFARVALRALGVQIAEEPSGWLLTGRDRLAASGETVDAGPSGLTARLLIASAVFADRPVTVVGRDRLPERPMGDLVQALRTMGVAVESEKDTIPVTVVPPATITGGEVTIDLTRSTQFATALAMIGPLCEQGLDLTLAGGSGARGYLDLTVDVMEAFGASVKSSPGRLFAAPGGYRPARFRVEPDASAAVYPMVAVALAGGRVTIAGLGRHSHQPDLMVADVLAEMGADVEVAEDHIRVEASGRALDPIDVDMSGAPDGALAIAIACARGKGPSRIRGLGTLRDKESDRLRVLAGELAKLGPMAHVEDDTVVIVPGPIRPASIDPHNDHRIAMSAALLGLLVSDVEVESPEVVDKTWPGFWEMLRSL